MRRNYTLPEIMFSIALLAFAGAFFARMYMQAETMRSKARDLDVMSLAAQSAVADFKTEYAHSGTVYFDRDFRPVPEKDEKGFVLTVDAVDDGTGLFDVTVNVVKPRTYFGETEPHTFSLATTVYRPALGTVQK